VLICVHRVHLLAHSFFRVSFFRCGFAAVWLIPFHLAGPQVLCRSLRSIGEVAPGDSPQVLATARLRRARPAGPFRAKPAVADFQEIVLWVAVKLIHHRE